MSLSGKTALVTGAAQGIGRDIALALAADGADVAICDVNLEAAQKTAADIEAKGSKSLAIKTNVAASAEVTAMIDQVVEKLGRIDILVNNAGITRDGLILRMKDEDWDLVLSINLKARSCALRQRSST
jgi:3-oxoacyl-[acyl-carrier protein] reductase